MRTVYDAANIRNIPASATLIGYYVDGRYVPSGADMAKFTHARFIPIAVFPTDDKGVVFDGPPDNGTWPGVVDWVVLRRRAGVDPTVYTDLDQWTTGVAEFRARGVDQPHWWIASWNGKAELIPGAVAHQYRGDQTGGFDLSVAADYWPGVDPAPAPPSPPPAPSPAPAVPSDLEDLMIITNVTPKGTDSPGLWLLSGPLYAHIPVIGDANALKSAGVQQVAISYEMHQNLLAGAASLKGALSGSLAVSGSLNVT